MFLGMERNCDTTIRMEIMISRITVYKLLSGLSHSLLLCRELPVATTFHVSGVQLHSNSISYV